MMSASPSTCIRYSDLESEPRRISFRPARPGADHFARILSWLAMILSWLDRMRRSWLARILSWLARIDFWLAITSSATIVLLTGQRCYGASLFGRILLLRERARDESITSYPDHLPPARRKCGKSSASSSQRTASP